MFQKDFLCCIRTVLRKPLIVLLTAFWRCIGVNRDAVHLVRVCQIVADGSDVFLVGKILNVDVRLVETEEDLILFYKLSGSVQRRGN